MIKRIVVITSLLVIGLILTGCTKPTNEVGNIDNVLEKIITNNGHSEEDIKKTFDIIKKQFNTSDFEDCELLTLTYGKYKDLLEAEKGYAQEHNAEEAIILHFTFITDNKPYITFISNEEYDYSAYFIKVNNEWKMVTWGQG